MASKNATTKGTRVSSPATRLLPAKARPSRRPKANGVGRPKASADPVDAELAIREAALELFSARNFSTVTTKDIAEATGLNTALIYYYFGSKEELFRSAVALAVERAFHQFRISRKDHESPREVITGWLDNHIREYATILKLIKVSIDYASTADRKAGIDRAIRRFYVDEREVLREALSAGVARGDFRKVDVDATSTFISTYLDGVFVRSVILKDFDPVAAIGELRSFLDSLLVR